MRTISMHALLFWCVAGFCPGLSCCRVWGVFIATGCPSFGSFTRILRPTDHGLECQRVSRFLSDVA